MTTFLDLVQLINTFNIFIVGSCNDLVEIFRLLNDDIIESLLKKFTYFYF
jgi:hypothetical protein